MLKRFLDYYGFSKVEQRGFFTLVVLIFLVLGFQVLYKFTDKSSTIDHHITYFSMSENRDARTELAIESPVTTTGYKHQGTRKAEIKYFSFDPNGLPAEKWQELGFSAKQAAAIKNYEAKGGKFYKKEDVAKMYVISEKDYARIAPYIVIKKSKQKEVKEPAYVRAERTANKDREMKSIQINLADTTDFKTLRGIGSVLATRTVRYREALGGFHRVEQVGEVYGISPETFENIRPLLLLDETPVKKLNINTASQEELSRHPYISKKQAQLIVNYRAQHGLYTNFLDLRKIHVIDEEFFRKIEPYIEW